MSKPQYAILRFAKYKGPEIGNIEAHNERTKEKYASNPDVDISRSKYNFHLIEFDYNHNTYVYLPRPNNPGVESFSCLS